MIIIISHQERILNIADKVLLLADGKISDYGSREEILPGVMSGVVDVCGKVTEQEVI